MEEKEIIKETEEYDESKYVKHCKSCGEKMPIDDDTCPVCGAEQREKKASKPIDKKKLIIIGGCIAAVIAIIIVISVVSYRNSLRYYWNKVNDEYPSANCGLGSDCISIDTNIYDIDTDDMTYGQYTNYQICLKSTLDAIKWLNEELGFSSSVYEEMMETSYNMGTRTAYADDYRVSWSYHPNKGLEVKYYKE